jgi:ER membrane protein complex subunit 2
LDKFLVKSKAKRMDELENLLAAYDADPVKFSRNTEKTLDLLSRLRKSKLNRPDIVFKNGLPILKKGGMDKNGGEWWNLMEQVCIAALEYGDFETSSSCITNLAKKFNNGEEESSRVGRLEGMLCESKGDYDNAMKKYDKLLEKNGANAMVLKRKAALYRGKGDFKNASKALNDVVKMYASDVQAWGEMAELYLEIGDYDSAAFALQELILLNPLCVAYHTRLAEVYYGYGDCDNLIKARKHYAISLNTQASNLNKRALYGLITTCNQLLEIHLKITTKNNEKAITKELLDWAKEQLMEYITDNTEMTELEKLVANSLLY